MSQASQEVTAATVIGNFSITLPAPNQAQLSASGYLVEGEDKASLDARMDTVREALQRQQRMLEIPVLEAHIEQYEKARDDIERAYADLLERQKAKAAGRSGAKALSSQDQANLKNAPQQLKGIEAELEKARKKIAAARAGV
jgi:predicted  nucleic acid-binding Zn-ribbon protein